MRGDASYALSLTSYARFVVRRVPACNEHKVRRAKESLGYGAGVALRRVNLTMAGGGENSYVVDHIRFLMWRPALCGAGDAGPARKRHGTAFDAT